MRSYTTEIKYHKISTYSRLDIAPHKERYTKQTFYQNKIVFSWYQRRDEEETLKVYTDLY